jgi:bacteriorhodopsin
MKYLKGVLVGIVAAIIVTIIYAVLEIRKATAFARAAGFDGEVGVDLSFLTRDPQYLSLVVASFGIGFFLVVRSRRRK